MKLIKTAEFAKAIESALEGREVYILIPITGQTKLEDLKGFKTYGISVDEPGTEHYKCLDREAEEGCEPESEADQEEEPEKKAPIKKEIDHGKICALYKAGWNCSQIADDVQCHVQTVINHLQAEGIYKARRG